MKLITSDLPLEVISITAVNNSDLTSLDIKETGDTFKDNAIIKAKAYADKSGLLTLADDSGLLVDALNGRPGVYSKRFGKDDKTRNQKLLRELKDKPKNKRTARFECVVAICDPLLHQTHTCPGQVRGYITLIPKGSHGFGYDPIFYSTELGKTFGQATTKEKNQVSHRARALIKAKRILKQVIINY